MESKKISVFKIFMILVFGYFFWLMLRLTLDYFPAKPDVSFLMIKQSEVTERQEYLPIFYTHVYTSIFVLLSGFLAISRPKFLGKNFHRISGKIYVVLLLVFSAPAGIYMGFFANGGIFSKISFVILGVLWWFSTFKAFIFAKKLNFSAHKKWMWRSFALALSAVTLRMWKVVIAHFTGMNPMEIYQIIAWLGWIPNLVFVEILIKFKKSNLSLRKNKLCLF